MTTPEIPFQEPTEGLLTNAHGEWLAFRQPFDGSQPRVQPEEQMEALSLFDDYVTGVLNARNSGFTTKYNAATGKFDDGRKTSFYTIIDRRDVEVSIQKIDREPPYRDVMIGLSERQNNRRAGHGTYYHLEQDGVVRRYDQILPSIIEQDLFYNQIDPSKPMSPHEAEEILAQDLLRMREVGENRRMASTLGLNDQPVGLRELQELFQLLDKAMALDSTT